MNRKAPKPKKCRCGCGESFVPARPLQVAKTTACALRLVEKKKAKEVAAAKKVERKAAREAKERLKTRSDYLKEAQIAFNAFIRLRDAGRPCICCGKPLGENEVGGAYDCGHYRSVGSAPHLRFDERNAHAQRKFCNRYGAGRAVDYRIGLIARIGLAAVEALEADQSTRKWTADDLKAIRDLYRAKLKELLRARTGSIS